MRAATADGEVAIASPREQTAEGAEASALGRARSRLPPKCRHVPGLERSLARFHHPGSQQAQFRDAALEECLALVDHHDTGVGQVEVLQQVGGEKHGGSLCDLPQELPDLHTLYRVDPDGRLVEENQRRVTHDRARDTQPLAIPAREGANPLAGALLDPGRRHRLGRDLCALCAVDTASPRRIFHDRMHPLQRGHRETLWKVPDVTPHLLRIREISIPDVDRSRLKLREGGEQPHQGRLPGTIRPQQTDEPGAHGRRQTPKGLTATIGMMHVNAPDDDSGHGAYEVEDCEDAPVEERTSVRYTAPEDDGFDADHVAFPTFVRFTVFMLVSGSGPAWTCMSFACFTLSLH